MKFEDMMNKATAYQAARQIIDRKPQLIQESRTKIYNLEKQIDALEEKATKAAMNEIQNKMNPLKFFAKKEEDYQAQIRQLEDEIKNEQRKLDGLERSKTADFIDVEAVAVEALQIIAEQSKEIATHEQKVLEAQAAYHTAIEYYKDELHNQRSFARRVQAFQQTVNEESFIPNFPNEEVPFDQKLRIENFSFSSKITTKHRMRPELEETLRA